MKYHSGTDDGGNGPTGKWQKTEYNLKIVSD